MEILPDFSSFLVLIPSSSSSPSTESSSWHLAPASRLSTAAGTRDVAQVPRAGLATQATCARPHKFSGSSATTASAVPPRGGVIHPR